MLTESRIKKILGLVKKEYDYMDNKPIHIIDRYGWGRCWCVDTITSGLILSNIYKYTTRKYTNHTNRPITGKASIRLRNASDMP